jgi:hypothetical protein
MEIDNCPPLEGSTFITGLTVLSAASIRECLKVTALYAKARAALYESMASGFILVR